MDDKQQNADAKSSYDALRSMFLHPPVYLPPPLGGGSLEGLVPGVLPGQGAASNLMFGHPFAPGLPMLPYRDFAYLPFPAAAAAMEGNRSGQSPTDGAAAASAANFWTGLYPFMADPFLAEAMKMNLSPFLAQNEGKDKKSSSSKDHVKKSSSPKTEVKDLKRKPERSSSTHSDGSSSSHDRQTPGSKSPATRTTASPHRKEERNHPGPPPLIKTPPLAHERKRPKLDPSLDEVLDFSSKPKLLDNKRSLLPCREERDKRELREKRSTPNFGDVEWLSNPDSSPKKERSDAKNADLFNTDPRSVLRGEALQVRIAQYNVSQLRSKLDLDDDNNWTARIEPEFNDLGQYKQPKPDRNENLSAFERVDHKLGSRDSVIVSRSEPKSFSERMSAIARRHAAANDLKDSGLDLRGLGKPTLDLRGLTSAMTSPYPRDLDLKLPRSEPSKDESKSESESLTLKDSVDNILDSILNTYNDDEPDEDKTKHSKHHCDDVTDVKVNPTKEPTDIPPPKLEDKIPNSKPIQDTTTNTTISRDPSPAKPLEVDSVKAMDTMSGGEMHGLSASSFLPLSEVLSTAINSEFARSQTIPSTMNIPNQLFPQSSRDDSPHMAIENIIDRLENEDDEDDDDSRGEIKIGERKIGEGPAMLPGCLGDGVRNEGVSVYRGTPLGGELTGLSFNTESNNGGTGSDILGNSTLGNSANSPEESKLCSNVNSAGKQIDLQNGGDKTKLVLVKDSRNGYAVKSKEGLLLKEGPPEFGEGLAEGLITSAVVEKVVNAVMLPSNDTENGLFKVPENVST